MKTGWHRLGDMRDTLLSRGDRILIVGADRYDWINGDIVEFMVFDPQEHGNGLGLIRVTGYKAGLIFVVFPLESGLKNPNAISTDWLKNNWREWVHNSDPNKDVWISEQPPDIVPASLLENREFSSAWIITPREHKSTKAARRIKNRSSRNISSKPAKPGKKKTPKKTS